jgi:hypothetical protein
LVFGAADIPGSPRARDSRIATRNCATTYLG